MLALAEVVEINVLLAIYVAADEVFLSAAEIAERK
jgi:hypothetical protein